MIALHRTPFERGERTPAELLPPVARPARRQPRHRPRVGADEMERRRQIAARAVQARALPADETQVGRWAKGRNAIQDKPLARILAYLGEGAA